METIDNVLMWYSIISPVIAAIVTGVGLHFAWMFFYRKEHRMLNNAKRPIMIFKCDGMDMEVETRLLRDIGYFRIDEEPCSNYQMADRITDHGLVIVAYGPGIQNFDEILSRVRDAKVPLIVYAKDRIPDEVTAKIRSYSWCLLCQYPLRLVNDVFGVLYTFPHG